MTKKNNKTKKSKIRDYLKYSYAKPTLIAVAMIALAIIGATLLFSAGEFFIEEAVQEVSIKDTDEKNPFGINIGDKAPHFEIEDIDGNPNTLSDFLRRPLVITFWTTWNSLSADQIKIVDEYILKDSEPLFNIITINNQEDKSIVESFMRRGGYKAKVLLDEDGAVGELYKVRTLPLTYFIDKDGIIQNVLGGVLSEEMLLGKVEKIIR